MIKLKSPQGGGGVSFEGNEYKPNKDGTVNVPIAAAADLIKFHKFEVIGTVEAEAISEEVIETEEAIQEEVLDKEPIADEIIEETVEGEASEEVDASNKKASNKKNR